MRLGVHVSIGLGLRKTIERAERLGCECLQMFSSSPSSWRIADLDPAGVEAFRAGIAGMGIRPVALHTPYLLNLASAKPQIWHLSWRTLAAALERAQVLGAQYVATHIGSHGGEGFEAGAERIRQAVTRALEAQAGPVMVLLEGSSGAGNTVGSTFEEQAALVEKLASRSDRVGICLDTAHLWGAGYDLSSAEKVDKVLSLFDRVIGLPRLHIFHLNDTQKELGSRADRHWHIGKGKIGIDGFRAIVNHPALTDIPGIIETPEMELGKDKENLETLKGLRVASQA